MNDEKFIKLAIEEAKKSQEAGGAPNGAVLVKDGEVISTGWSLVWPKKDPTAHGETECLRKACQILNTIDLSGCTLYSTLESCSMCLGCAAWSNVSEIVFGAFKEDIQPNPYEIRNYHALEHGQRLQNWKGENIKVRGGVLREECAELMKNIKNWTQVL